MTIPLAAIRAQKVASIIALAHEAVGGDCIPGAMWITNFDSAGEPDLSFHCDSDVYAVWLAWLGGDTVTSEYHGEVYATTTATAQIELGKVVVCFTTSSPIKEAAPC